jgi:predicted amidohydrolase
MPFTFQAAAEQGCRMLFLPENFSFLGTSPAESLAVAEALQPVGPTLRRYCDLAERTGLWLSLGGFQERGPDPQHLHNCHVVLDSAGRVAASYRKVHLFNVDVPGGPVLMESRRAAGPRTWGGRRQPLTLSPAWGSPHARPCQGGRVLQLQ